MASTLTSYAGDDRIAHVRPGPAFAVAAAALAALLLATLDGPGRHSRRGGH